MRIVFAVVILGALLSSAQAQTKASCKIMASATAKMLNGISPMVPAVDDLEEHIPTMRSVASGEGKNAVDRFEDSRRKLSIALKEFVNSSRDLHHTFESCS